MASSPKTIARMQKDAVGIFDAGLQAVDPGVAVKNYCRLEGDHFFIGEREYDLSRFNNIFVIRAGKASAPMAAAIEEFLGKRITTGIINVKYGHVTKLNQVKLIEAGHPVPDQNGETGSRAILNLAQEAGEDDLLLCLMSGGGSALLPLAAPGLTLKDKQDTIKVLLACGATIHEINTIRKHTSMIKGGRLAQAVYPAMATASNSTLSADRVVGQIHHARSLGASGFTVFDFQPGTAASILPGVSLGAGSQRAVPPHKTK